MIGVGTGILKEHKNPAERTVAAFHPTITAQQRVTQYTKRHDCGTIETCKIIGAALHNFLGFSGR
jgi:hypothetical protein